MLIAIIPVLFAIVGALVYALASNAKAAELGRLMFLAALIALMFVLAKHTVRIG